MLTVDSIERRRFEGLDMVVPKELVRECVRLCIGIDGGVRGPVPTGIASSVSYTHLTLPTKRIV